MQCTQTVTEQGPQVPFFSIEATCERKQSWSCVRCLEKPAVYKACRENVHPDIVWAVKAGRRQIMGAWKAGKGGVSP